MKSFFVGLLVIIMFLIVWVMGMMLLPYLILLGFFLRWLVGVALVVLVIWLIGKITLLAVDSLRKP